jgi:membrane-associated phospholipid phosphatase
LNRLITIEHGNLLMLCVFIFFIVLALIANAPTMGRFDRRMTASIQHHHRPWLDRVARGATFLGNTEVMIAIGIGVAGYLLVSSSPWAALISSAGLLGMPISGAIKQLVGRQRPQSEIARVVLPVVGLSFPSGHAMTAIMYYGFIAFLIGVHLPGGLGRALVAGLVLLILVITWSRIYLGAHWFSDVMGGLAGGSFLLFLMTLIYRRLAVGEIVTG